MITYTYSKYLSFILFLNYKLFSAYISLFLILKALYINSLICDSSSTQICPVNLIGIVFEIGQHSFVYILNIFIFITIKNLKPVFNNEVLPFN